MAFLALIMLALIALWLLVLVGWVFPLVGSIVFRRRGKLARVLRITWIGWLVGAVVTAVLTYPIVRSTITSIPRSASAQDLEAFSDMYRVDRAQYGFSPIDKNARVDIERHSGGDAERRGYDVMLHIYGEKVSRTVAFGLRNGRYKWIGEQEVRRSGRTYTTADGEDWEKIVISYSTYARSGTMKGLYFDYEGDDQRLHKFELTLKDVAPVLREWDARSRKQTGHAPGD